jgi:hypothetical protein
MVCECNMYVIPRSISRNVLDYKSWGPRDVGGGGRRRGRRTRAARGLRGAEARTEAAGWGKGSSGQGQAAGGEMSLPPPPSPPPRQLAGARRPASPHDAKGAGRAGARSSQGGREAAAAGGCGGVEVEAVPRRLLWGLRGAHKPFLFFREFALFFRTLNPKPQTLFLLP